MKNSKQLFKKTVKPDFLVITAFFNVKHSNIFQGCNYTGNGVNLRINGRRLFLMHF